MRMAPRAQGPSLGHLVSGCREAALGRRSWPRHGLRPCSRSAGWQWLLPRCLPGPRTLVWGQMCCHRCPLGRGCAALVEGPGAGLSPPVYRCVLRWGLTPLRPAADSLRPGKPSPLWPPCPLPLRWGGGALPLCGPDKEGL